MKNNNNSITSSIDELPLKQVDLATILKASLVISEQLIPEKLAEVLMQIIMEESGAEKGYLLFERENQLSILAESTLKNEVETKIYSEIKIPENNFIQEKIIQDAIRTNENITINDFSKDKVYGTGKYISTTPPKSIACTPIVKDDKTIGIIYLENSHLTDVFKPEKVILLKILAINAAVALEKAILFNKLKLSKKRFQDIVDNSSAVIFAKLINGKYIFINKEFEKFRKVNKEKVLHHTDFDIFSKECAESYVAKDKLIIDTKKPFTYEEKIFHEDGMHTYVIAKFPLIDSDGKLYAVGGIATDITDLKRIQETLRENQNRFNYVLAATQDAIYDWDLESGRIWRNEQYEKSFDGPNGPSLEWWKHNIHPDEYADVTARLEAAFGRHDQLWNQEYRFKKVKEGYANIIDRGYIIYNKEKKPIRMIGALLDITERRKFIDDLERSLALSRATLESTADGILVVNSEEKIVDYNKRFAEMWHIPDSILQTRDDKKTIKYILEQVKDADKFISKVKELYANPEEESFDLIEFKDGRFFERYSQPQRTKANIIGRVWSFRDITERKKSEEADKKRIVKIIERQSELLRLNKEIGSLPLKEKLKKIIESDAKTMEVERVSILFFDLNHTSITSETTYILSKLDYGTGISIMRNEFPRYFSELEFNKIIDANNAETDPRTSELTEKFLKFYGITSLLNVPVKFKGKIVGIICHGHVGTKRNWTYEEMVFANSIADTVSLTLETEEREKTEEELKKLNEFLEERVKERTVELSANEEKFRAIIETANDAIISTDSDGTIIFWNRAAEKMFNYPSNEVVGKPIALIIPPRYIEKHKKAFDEYLKTKEAHHIGKGAVELFGLKKGNVEFPIELSLETWMSDNKDFFTAIIRDITESKEAEKALIKKTHELSANEERLRAVVETASDSIISANKEGNIIFWNKAAEKMFGFPSTEAIGQPITIIIPKQYLEKHKLGFDRYLQTKEAHIIGKGAVELSGLKKNGIEFPIELSLDNWKSNNEDFFTAIIRDITERKKAEESEKKRFEKLIEQQNELSKLSKLK